ncbi:hypothetical protein BDZ45DRAFT_681381 [Acephala macrosclerotiorum]|nr:hypothetical protein BDZ45DRAFT_681381 [Acephala macrosclerotiorum]
MGKGRGKKSRVENPKKKKEPKIKGLPKPNPTKIANKLAHKKKKAARLEELKEAIRRDPSLIKPFATPMQRTAPFMKNPNAAKWPALFKRQLGLIEMHIDSLTRIMNAMRNDGDSMSAEDKLDWELGERGNWRAICGMMDRARLVLSQTKEAAQGVLPEDRLRDKKKLGVVGTEFEPLVPKLDEKARAMGYDPKGKGALGRSMDFLDQDGKSLDQDGDTDMSDASDSSSDESDSDDGVTGGVDFISLDIGSRKKAKKDTANVVTNETPSTTEPNTFFVVDTEPTPVNISAINHAPPANDGLSNRKRKQMEKDEAAAARLAKRMAKKAAYEAEKAAAAQGNEEAAKEPSSPGVDFRELEAKLQAEIDNGTKAQQEEEAQEAAAAAKTAKKKRRRSSEGGEEVVKKAKKDKNEPEKKDKKEKKKRKADDADKEDSDKKKQRKHRDSDSE